MAAKEKTLKKKAEVLPVIGPTFLISVSQRLLGRLFCVKFRMHIKCSLVKRTFRGKSKRNKVNTKANIILKYAIIKRRQKLLSKALEMPTKTKLTRNFLTQKPQKHTRQSTMSIIFQAERTMIPRIQRIEQRM